ncbi:fructose-6-phosphate aldolase 2 [uncultured spirochete]|jgi:transaldolase|uniref:Fructose-6-phosphate aldolase 2 n=1 Tax=uncultured spirochete TaxID=156406 RepID=A0A3P3XQF0_9SPIR|nr:fructose-6-phosphate aldolase 2 [uncultured spirochete]
MKFFLDTANLKEIREIAEIGLIEGVTTNPTILSKEGSGWEKGIKEILTIVKGPVFAEVFSTQAPDMIREAETISSWNDRLVIKLPMIPEGVKAINALSKKGITTCATLIYSPGQAVVAALAGASYVAPFVARSFEIAMDGIQLIEDISNIFSMQEVETEILAASIRTPHDAVRALLAGADILTLPYGVLKQLMGHPLTDVTLKKFMDDWSAVNR